MALKLEFRGKQFGRNFSIRTGEVSRRVDKAITVALDKAAREIKTRGDANIRSAGNFGSRWTKGFKVRATSRGTRGRRREATIEVRHDVPYFPVFQEGRVIRGKPLLWIPLSFSDAVGTRARDYPGRLFRVDREGGKAPLLLSADDKEPKYSGHKSVKIPKKFRILEIARDVASRIKSFIKVPRR